jgi:hypothetical protein
MLLGFGIPNYDKAIAAMELILENEPDASKLLIYPNPVSPGSAIHISLPYSAAEVELLNSLGAVVHTFRISQSESTFYLGPFVSGKYYFRFTTESSSIIKPVLLL